MLEPSGLGATTIEVVMAMVVQIMQPTSAGSKISEMAATHRQRLEHP